MGNILNLSLYIKQENLWFAGNREYDDEYKNEIRNCNVKYIPLEMLRKEGILNCVQSFLRETENKQLIGLWLHINVDVFNETIIPCVGSRTVDGLMHEEFNLLTYRLFKSDKLTGFEIAILDPDLDTNGQYTKDFVLNNTSYLQQYFTKVNKQNS
ncbi:arginase family protein [Flavobacterium taihuense]|uniref:arginase family protein n=1 Tax=Flavobacterium taihuense TaxID=2857508 RepID=UPI0034E1DA6E